MVEFARHVLGYEDAHSTGLTPPLPTGVIDLMPDQRDVNQRGGTMRLGRYPCMLDIRSKAYALYGGRMIYERHRHRYEFNNDFREEMERNGLLLAGISPDKHIVEMVEIPDHPWFVGPPVPSGIQIPAQPAPSSVCRPGGHGAKKKEEKGRSVMPWELGNRSAEVCLPDGFLYS